MTILKIFSQILLSTQLVFLLSTLLLLREPFLGGLFLLLPEKQSVEVVLLLRTIFGYFSLL